MTSPSLLCKIMLVAQAPYSCKANGTEQQAAQDKTDDVLNKKILEAKPKGALLPSGWQACCLR